MPLYAHESWHFGYKEKKPTGIPKRKNRIGYRGEKVKEIPKEMKYFGYRESKKVRNTQQEK